MHRRVLVVEDETPTREAVRKILEDAQYEVDTAEDGEQAVGRIARQHYDVVVLDIGLPKLSGTDVMEFIASTTPELLASIIVVTGLTTTEIRTLFPTICETLSKPVMPKRLLAAVGRCLAFDELTRSSASSA